MYKKIRFLIVFTLAIIVTIVLTAGFVYSISITNTSHNNGTVSKTNGKSSGNKAADNKIKKLDTNSYNILVMGDSLAKGTGDESNMGFSNDFAKLFKTKAQKPIKVTNIAVNGDVSAGLLNIVKREQTLEYIKDSNMIFISIGGNEIKNFKNSNMQSNDLNTAGNLKNAQEKYLKNLEDILKLIRDKNQKSIIVFIGLYNPFGNDLTSDKLALLNEWNYKTSEVILSDENALYIPTYDLFAYNSKNYLSLDNFHPNSKGYDAISKRIFEALKDYKI